MRSPNPDDLLPAPDISVENLQTAQPGEFPIDGVDDLRPPENPMHRSQASIKTELQRPSVAEMSSYATASLSKLELRKSSTKLTNSSD